MSYFIDLTDKRNEILSVLLKESNKKVDVFSFEKIENIKKNDVIIFAPSKKINIDEAKKIPKEVTIFMGTISDEINLIFKNKQINYINLLKNELFAVKNSNLTAEGILALILENSPKSIFKNNVLILGSGRVGKSLAILLNKIGVNFSFCTFSEDKIANGFFFTQSNITKNQLESIITNFDVIINSIPAEVLSQKIINKIRNDALFLEIASLNTLKNFNISHFKYLLCPSLPQKYAVETAGTILFECINSYKI